MIDVALRDGGCEFCIRAKPGARRNAVTGIHAGALKVQVTAAPEKGKANQAIVALLADSIGVAKSNVSVVRGETSQDKVVRVVGVDAETLQQKLEACLL